MIKSRRVIWAGYVAHAGNGRNAYKIWQENLKSRDHLEEIGLDGRISSHIY
jgi:hypothetical protein